ncbi:hypothetical protein [Asticcacaulis sp. AC402]|uniref:hypothetical protein n=1 Tax=Asticcacaulis sp. AC402 TaxID=1282361 RepID=UPI0012DCA984|nr:hypothetical protein [Asticcacaulis sp. AC402]
MADQTDHTLRAAAPATSHLEDVEKVARDLRKLLNGCEGARLKADVKAQIENLNAWTDAYLDGLNAVQKLTHTGLDTLHDAQKELALSLEDYLRLEDEGGTPATRDQQHRTDEVSRALRRITMLIPAFDSTFADTSLAEPDLPDPGEPTPDPVPDPGQPEVPSDPQEPETSPDLQPDIPPVTQPEVRRPGAV